MASERDDIAPPAPKWMCQYCGKSVGIIGNWLARLFGVGIHNCDFSRCYLPGKPKATTDAR